jgi:hypothetical protein
VAGDASDEHLPPNHNCCVGEMVRVRVRQEVPSSNLIRRTCVTVHVLAMLDIYFVSVKYVFVSLKLMCVFLKFLKI